MADQFPEAPALSMLEADSLETISHTVGYRQLDEDANRIAHYLIGKGIGPESFVGLALPRSPRLLAALLGVLKAGAAYVSLDPAYPAERFRFMVEDTACPLILTVSELLEDLPESAGERSVALDILELDAFPKTRPDDAQRRLPLLQEHLALMVYTSGSTGKPKGVLLQHKGLHSTLCSDIGVLLPDAGSPVLHMASLNFGAASIHALRALVSGAHLLMVQDIDTLGAELGEVLEMHRITHAFLTGSMLAVLPQRSYPNLQVITVGAEKAAPDLMARWKERLFNVYAATETTMVATCHYCGLESENFPIGKAVAGVEVAVFDGIQPVSDLGELCVAGAGIARGYWRRPALTALKFTPHPSATVPGERLYRTGDLGKRNGEGLFEVQGRIDFLVKVRGHRVELGEIQAALSAHHQVHHAAVLAPADHEDVRHLVAFFIANAGETPDLDDLRDFLKARLPEYMVPHQFVPCERFPLTPNGKLDRRALQAQMPSQFGGSNRTAYRAPQTPMETRLCRLWASLLRRERLGVDDHFFRLGCDSLLANKLVVAVTGETGIRVPVRELFANPTIAQFAPRLEVIGRGESLRPVPRSATIPASPAQKQMWFLARSAGAAYNIPTAFEIRGSLSPLRLQRALDELVARHEPLRTHFRMMQGELVQVLCGDVVCPLAVVDLREVGLDADKLALRLAEYQSAQLFDLAEVPLIRALLCRTDACQWLLHIDLHHICGDITSKNLLFQELGMIYNRQNLEPLELQYADYAAWLAEHPTSAERLDWWRAYLEGIPKYLPLPLDFPRPDLQTYRGGAVRTKLEPGLLAHLERYAAHHGMTLYMLFRALFSLLLARLSNTYDVVLGLPLSQRTLAGLERMVGYMVNIIAPRIRIDEQQHLDAFLMAIREDTLAALAHQDVPFHELVKHVQPERDQRHLPIFQVVLVMVDAPLAPDFQGMTTSIAPTQLHASPFDLDLHLIRGEHELELHFVFNTDLFRVATISRISRALIHLAGQLEIGHNPLLAELTIIPAREREHLLHAPQLPLIPLKRPLYRLFSERVWRTPGQTAVLCGQSYLDYQSLHHRACRLANYLRRFGVGPEQPVGLLLGRSTRLPMAMLAVHMAGAAYLPLDPTNPEERKRFMLADAGCRVLISEGNLSESVQVDRVILLDRERDAIEAESEREPDHHTLPDQLAYLIYTSGSTGRPKGVQISHDSLSHLVQCMAQKPGFAEGERLLAVSTIAFDIATLEMFLPLVCGGGLMIAEDGAAADGKRLADLIDTHQVAVMQATPVTWQILLASGWQGRRGLRAWIGGEALPRSLVKDLSALGVEPWNLYGPTEATIYSGGLQLQPARDEAVQPFAPLIHKMPLLVLDAQLRLQPVGVPGQLYVAGPGLMRGYRHNAGLTAQQLVPNPFTEEAGQRLYATGDLALRQEGGCIAYLGRLDQQLKLRGYRIEPGEIEQAILEVSSIDEVAVTALHEEGETVGLCAWYTSMDDVALAGLRQQLGQHLPDYMIPTRWSRVDQLPITSNGKIDRKALSTRSPTSEKKPVRSGHWSNAETRMVALWEKVLARDGLDVADHFFDLGGHSLLAVRLLDEITSEFGVRLELPQLFAHPTPQSLATCVAQKGDRNEEAAVVALKRGGSQTPLFLVCGLFLYRELALLLDPDLPVYGVYIPAEVDLLRGEEAHFPSMEEMATSYVQHIRAQQPRGPYRLGGVSYGGLLAFEIARQLREAGESIDRVILLDTVLRRALKRDPWGWGMHHLQRGPRHWLTAFRKRLKREKPVEAPSAEGREEAPTLLPKNKIYRKASDHYKPKPAPGKIVLFRAKGLELPTWYRVEDDLGWRAIASDLEIDWIPGDHLGILTQPNVTILAEKLNKILNQDT